MTGSIKALSVFDLAAAAAHAGKTHFVVRTNRLLQHEDTQLSYQRESNQPNQPSTRAPAPSKLLLLSNIVLSNY